MGFVLFGGTERSAPADAGCSRHVVGDGKGYDFRVGSPNGGRLAGCGPGGCRSGENFLRVLQDKKFQPLGSSRTVKVDVRVITATNKDLEKEFAMGSVRSDLYYRLNVFSVPLLPLCKHGPDNFFLADHYARESSKEVNHI